MHQMKIFVQLLSAAVLIQPLLAVPIFWFLPWRFPTATTTSGSTTSSSSSSSSGASNSSNVSVAIGNRVNTSTGLDDYGTNISNVQINLNRNARSIDDRVPLVQLDGVPVQLPSSSYGRMELNGSYITVGEHTIRLPANVSNVTVNTYLVNGIPVDEGIMMPPSPTGSTVTNVNDSNPLVTAVRIFRSFLRNFFNDQNSIA